MQLGEYLATAIVVVLIAVVVIGPGYLLDVIEHTLGRASTAVWQWRHSRRVKARAEANRPWREDERA